MLAVVVAVVCWSQRQQHQHIHLHRATSAPVSHITRVTATVSAFPTALLWTYAIRLVGFVDGVVVRTMWLDGRTLDCAGWGCRWALDMLLCCVCLFLGCVGIVGCLTAPVVLLELVS